MNNKQKDILVVIDLQNDFVSGSLGNKRAQSIVSGVLDKVSNFNGDVIFTRDSHNSNYLQTKEGKFLPVKHCILGTPGWEIVECLDKFRTEHNCKTFNKEIFGSYELINYLKNKYKNENIISVSFVGLCTDVCVVSNALMLRSAIPELEIHVISNLCAGTSPENHKNALNTMQRCNIIVE